MIQILREGSPARKALDKIQAQIRDMKLAITNTERADLPPVEVRQALMQAFEAAEYRDVPSDGFQRFQLFDGGAQQLPDRHHVVKLEGAAASIIREGLTLSDLSYIFGRDRIVDLLMERFASMAQRAPGLPADERTEKLRALRAQLEQLEREEEFATLELESAGHTILRREDVSLPILFDVWDRFQAGEEVQQ